MGNPQERPSSSEEMLREARERATSPDIGSEHEAGEKPEQMLSPSEMAAALRAQKEQEEKLRDELADAASAENAIPEQEDVPDSSIPHTKEALRKYPLVYSENRWSLWKRLFGGDPDTEERAKMKGEAPFGYDAFGDPKKTAEDGVGATIRKIFGRDNKGKG